MTVGEIIKLREIVDYLYSEEIKFSINCAYSLLKLKNKLDEIFNLVLCRLHLIFPNEINFSNLKDDEKIIFNTLMDNQIEDCDIIKLLNNLTFDEIIKNKEVEITIPNIDFLEKMIELYKENKLE